VPRGSYDTVLAHPRPGTNPASILVAVNHIQVFSRSLLVVILVAGAAAQGCSSSETNGEDASSDQGGGGSDNLGGAGSGGSPGGTSGSGGGGGAMSGGAAGSDSSGGAGRSAGGGGSGGGAGSGGSGAVGGNFACDEAVCVRGERYCRYYLPGTGGMPGYTCDPFPASCSARSDCSCFCTPDQGGLCRLPFNGMSCTCTHTDGAVFMTCDGA
jgi:hypothetical protein